MPPRKKKAPAKKKRKASEINEDDAGPSNAPAVEEQQQFEEEEEEQAQQAAAGRGVAALAPEAEAQSLEENRAAAIVMLVQQGVPEQRAERAVDATIENYEDVGDWADAAAVWLAIDNECADESNAMGTAMQVSLVEAEEKKAAETPLKERTTAEIIDAFPDSELIVALTIALTSKELLLPLIDGTPTMKEKLASYLQMEKKCKRWYDCSTHYFVNAAEQIQKMITEAPSNSQQPKNDAVEDAEVSGALLLSFLEKEVAALEVGVYITSGNADQPLPPIFAQYAQKEEVELLD